MRIKAWICISVSLLVSLCLSGQSVSQVNLRKEVLASGLTCYFIRTDAPTVDYYLIQNVGSSQEQENEDGLAHFTEHLSFLSTEHFDRPVSDFFKYHQIENNASTYQDKIIYYMKGIQRENTALNDSCLLVLRDWCGGLKLKENEVEKEKRVVMEEWRSGTRRSELELEYARLLYNHTRLARLSGLGNMELLGRMSVVDLRAFCKRWFSPRQAAIVIQGNIDSDACITQVREVFRDMVADPDYKERKAVTIPEIDTVTYKRVTIPDNTNTITVAMRMKDSVPVEIDAFCRARFYGLLYKQLMETRMRQYKDAGEGALHRYRIDYGQLTKEYKVLQLEITPFTGLETKALKQLMGHHYDLTRNGLSEHEIEDLKVSYRWHFLLGKEKLDYTTVAEDNFLRGYPLFTAEDYNRTIQSAMENFSNTDFIRFCRENLSLERNLMLFVYGQQKSVYALRQEVVEKIVTDTTLRSIVPEVKTVDTTRPLLQAEARIISEQRIEDYDATVWRFANGLTFVYRRTSSPYMQLNGYSQSGLSAFTAWDRPVGEALLSVAELSGTKEYNRQALERFKYVNGIDFSWRMDEKTAIVEVSCPSESLDAALQLLYLKLGKTVFVPEAPGRMDKVGYELAAQRTQRDEYKEMLDKELYGMNKQVGTLSRSYFQNVTGAKLESAFGRMYGNVSKWIYVLTGDAEPAMVKAKITEWLGNLGGTVTTGETPTQQKLILKKDVTREVIYNTPDNNGGTDMNYVYTRPLIGDERIQLELLTKVLRNRYNEELRDKKAMIYGMYMECYSRLFPSERSVININFGSKKEDQKPIAEYIDRELKAVAQKGVTVVELEKAWNLVDRNRFDADEFLTVCRNTYFREPSSLINLRRENLPERVTPESIQKFARKLEAKSLLVRFVFK